MQTFVEAKNIFGAIQKFPQDRHISKVVKVEGGYIAFEFMDEYEIWVGARDA